MKRAVHVWRLVAAEDRQSLRRLFRCRPRDERIIVCKCLIPIPDASHQRVESAVLPSGMKAAPDDILLPVRLLVQGWINENLWGLVRPLVSWNAARDRQMIRIMPKHLLGAMWLQFARAVVGDVKYRPCKVCGKWLTLSTEDDGFRSDREFCTAACRQKDYRGKVKEAKRLKAEGKTVRQLAKHFGTTPTTIKNWLTKEK
jgi:hypothetical protein